MRTTVWVFCGMQAKFPSAVFGTRNDAEAWIQRSKVSGTLTEYPVGISAYDWAIENGHFVPKKPEQSMPTFIARFSSASQAHEHYENGSAGDART